jgi:superfamily II DNA/RNA helicase
MDWPAMGVEMNTLGSELGIKPDLLKILEQQNYKEAFAVQSTVIPLLLHRDEYVGICSGSGGFSG